MPHKHIHRILKEHIPSGVHKAKRLVAFKYPKLLLLALSIIFAYYIFSLPEIRASISNIGEFDYISNLIAGILFSFGFTTAFSVGYLITAQHSSIILASIVAALGALAGDLITFKTIKFSFMDEFKQLEKQKALKKIGDVVKHNKHVLIRHYLIYIFAGLVLASPLPDEIGVSMLAGLTTIKPKVFALISFLLHLVGFYIIIYLGAM